MSTIRANTITDAAGTGSPNFPNGLSLASPTLTGVPTAPTATAATSTTQIATTDFVTTANNLKANLASPTFTGTPLAPTASVATNTTQIATTAFVIANQSGVTLLGTLTTTSGASQSLTSLTLTDYKSILVRLNGVSSTSNAIFRIQGGAGSTADISDTMTNVSNLMFGEVSIELASSNAWYISSIGNTNISSVVRMNLTSVTTAVTSITFTPSAGTFDAGIIRVYGVK